VRQNDQNRLRQCLGEQTFSDLYKRGQRIQSFEPLANALQQLAELENTLANTVQDVTPDRHSQQGPPYEDAYQN
jgi:hypothetical protein